MSDRRLTIWEQAQRKGYSRRDFLRFCSWMAAAAGIPTSAIGQVVRAMDTKPRLPVVWFHFQECTCCSESFIRSSHPMVADILLDKISLDYTETLQAAAGKQAEEALHNTMKKYKGQYLMLVEGAVPLADGGIYCCIGGRTALDIVTRSGRRGEGHRLPGAAAPPTAASRPPTRIRPAPLRFTRSSPASRSSTSRAARRSAR